MPAPARVQKESTAIQVVHHTTTPSDLLRMAVEQGADIEKLQRLMDLQDRWEANEARKDFTVAMTGFKAEPVEILKRKNVSFTTRDGDTTSYNHAELSDITEAIGEGLAKHQLSYRWDVHQEGPVVRVDCILTHVRGHSEKVTMHAAPDASGKKNGIQQVASTVTYLQRYTLLAITGTATKGMDDDGRTSEAPETEQEDPAAMSVALDWISTAEALTSLDEYKAKKAEVVSVYGDVKDVPKSVLHAFNAKFHALNGQSA